MSNISDAKHADINFVYGYCDGEHQPSHRVFGLRFQDYCTVLEKVMSVTNKM